MLAAWMAFSCSSEESGGGSAGGGGTDAGSTPFASSPCFACLEQSCAAEQSTCGSDPGCAAFLDCAKSCPTDQSGNVSQACQSACPVGETSSAQAARLALVTCQQGGAGLACKECGFGPDAGGSSSPALNQQCSPSSLQDACDKCLYGECCESMDAITKPGPTKDLADCWYNCNDYACEVGCYEKYPDGIPAFGGWSACVGVKCAGTGTCPAPGGSCGKCMYQKCGEELANCTTNSECYLARECVGSCSAPECVSTCRDAHPSTLSLFDALAICLQVNCTSACGA